MNSSNYLTYSLPRDQAWNICAKKIDPYTLSPFPTLPYPSLQKQLQFSNLFLCVVYKCRHKVGEKFASWKLLSVPKDKEAAFSQGKRSIVQLAAMFLSSRSRIRIWKPLSSRWMSYCLYHLQRKILVKIWFWITCKTSSLKKITVLVCHTATVLKGSFLGDSWSRLPTWWPACRSLQNFGSNHFLLVHS